MSKITASDISLNMTEYAKKQLALILVNDFTLDGLVFRLKIDGKGCNGFDYALGFTPPEKDDVIFQIQDSDPLMTISIDPFTAHYCREGVIDYLWNEESDQEGFVYINPNEKKYRGKFFKDESTLPPGN